MSDAPRLDDLVLAVQMGRAAVDRRRLHLKELADINAEPLVLAVFRMRLQVSEEAHAADLADLERLAAG